jgi:hypothetical protein
LSFYKQQNDELMQKLEMSKRETSAVIGDDNEALLHELNESYQ